MGKTSIEWTDETWNPLRGCSRETQGCMRCYAEQVARRFSGKGQPYEGLVAFTSQGAKWTGVVQTVPGKLAEPLQWKQPRAVFVNSMSDLFHPAVPFEYIAAVFGAMALAPAHTFQVLTKRVQRMRDFCRWAAGEGARARAARDLCVTQFQLQAGDLPARLAHRVGRGLEGTRQGAQRWPLPNALLGASVEDQPCADMRRDALRAVSDLGWKTWVSYEPALGPVSWSGWEFITWMVSGGKSGPKARLTRPEWHRAARDWCCAAHVPYCFKQWGAWLPHEREGEVTGFANVGKRAAGRLLDGHLHDAMPFAG